MIWLPLLALGTGVAVVATSKRGSSPSAGGCCGQPSVGRAPIRECLAFSWQPDAVDQALEHVLAEHPPEVGGTNWIKTEPTKSRSRKVPTRKRIAIGGPAPDVELATRIAEHVYDHTPNGDAMSWPPVPGDCPQVMAIWGRTVIRVRRHLAALEDGAADEAWWGSGGR